MVDSTDLDALNWIFAKTLADTEPHHYILQHQCPGIFEEMKARIIAEGVDEDYTFEDNVKSFRYLYLGGSKYWRMGLVIYRVEVKEG